MKTKYTVSQIITGKGQSKHCLQIQIYLERLRLPYSKYKMYFINGRSTTAGYISN